MRSIHLGIKLILLFVSSIATANHPDLENSIVKVFTTSNDYNYRNPWASPTQLEVSGSGFIIDGDKILTNAHVVSNATFVEVMRGDSDIKYQAEVSVIGHDCDLAILKVKDKKFFEGSTALKIEKDPNLQEVAIVYGYPMGGRELSITKGIVSRMEVLPNPHSFVSLLSAQLDAAINPGNSGGPVFSVDGKVIGVVNMGAIIGQNLGYMIPASVIKHFLDDAAVGKYDGFPGIGILAQIMENPSLRDKYKMKENQTGILVNKVYSSGAKSAIKPGDILLEIDGVNIYNSGKVRLKSGRRVSLIGLISQKFIGDKLDVSIMRDGKKVSKQIVLKYPQQHEHLVPRMRYDEPPEYYTYGGLVFQPLSQNYLITWGRDWNYTSPASFMSLFNVGWKTDKKQQVIVLNRVLTSEVNKGYQGIKNAIVEKVNDKAIKSLEDLISFCDNAVGKHIVFTLSDGNKIVLDINQVKKHNHSILKRYGITKDRFILNNK